MEERTLPDFSLLKNAHITLLEESCFNNRMAKQLLPGSPTGMDPAKMYVWLKGVETKLNTLVREVDILKNDLLRKHQDVRRDFKVMNEDLLALRREQEQTLQKMDLVVRELKQTAGAEEVAVLKKYVDLWNPLHFVTQQDLERALHLPSPSKEEKHTPFM